MSGGWIYLVAISAFVAGFVVALSPPWIVIVLVGTRKLYVDYKGEIYRLVRDHDGR